MKIKRIFRLRYIYILLFAAFIILSICRSQTVLKGAADIILLWAKAVLPALLPFFIASQALLLLGCAPAFGRILKPLMRFMGMPKAGGYALAMSLLCGYPTGARMCGELYNQKYISLSQLKPLSVLCHSSGPVFITGSVAAAILGAPELGLPLLIIHYLACLFTGSLYGLFSPAASRQDIIQTEEIVSSIGEIMRRSILSSIKAILSVGGYMLLFGVIIALADDFGLLNGLAGGIIAGIMEMTNGISRLSALGLPLESLLPICSFLLSFSGLSICMQALAFLPKEISPLFFIGARAAAAGSAYILCRLYIICGSLIPPLAAAITAAALLSLIRRGLISRTGRGTASPGRHT